MHPAARAALLAAIDQGWADPGRLYGEARRARLLLDAARESVAGVIGARADEVSFCASGTAAAHLAVLGTLRARAATARHLVTSAVEHSAVLEAARWHEADGGTVTTVGVDGTGRVDAADYERALRADTALASLQHGNSEVGTLQPVEAVGEACSRRGVPLHVDAAQSVGRLDPPGGWSLLTASAHKWGGPPGVGVLAVRRDVRWRSPLPSDEREGHRVAGYPSVPAIVAAATALEAVDRGMRTESARLAALVERLRRQVAATVPDVEVVGHPDERLPHVVTFSCLYVDGESLVLALDRKGFAVTSGSACTTSSLEPSHVLAAMGVLTHGNVRVSLPRGVAEADVDAFLAVLPRVVAALRDEAGVVGL
jgi:cysteine desulfurase